MAALATRCLEAVPHPVPMRLARLSVDLLRGCAGPAAHARHGDRAPGQAPAAGGSANPPRGSPGGAGRADCSFAPPRLQASRLLRSCPPAPRRRASPLPRRSGSCPATSAPWTSAARASGSGGAWSAEVWCRLRVPVVAGEEPSPLRAPGRDRGLRQRDREPPRPRALRGHQPGPQRFRRAGAALRVDRCGGRDPDRGGWHGPLRGFGVRLERARGAGGQASLYLDARQR